MNCTNKFTITKGMDNEFILTIKQTGTTMPMEISNNEINKTLTFTPTSTYVPYTAEIPYIAATAHAAAVVGQPYIPSVTGVVKKYKVTAAGLVANSVYSLIVNNTTIDLTNNVAVYTDTYDVLIALRDAINNGTTSSTVTISGSSLSSSVQAVVDSNTLVISGINDGYDFTVNGSNEYYIIVTQEPVTAVAGQAYIASKAEVLADPGQAYAAAKPAHYKATNAAVAVDISNIVSGYTVTNIKIGDDVGVASVNGINSATNGWYDVGTTTNFDIAPTINNNQLDKPLDSIELKVKLTLANSVDSFYATLTKLSDDTVALAKAMIIESAINGKIKLLISTAEADALVSEKGDSVDFYYTKPTYKLVIDCNTLNNGKFLAKIPFVYVE